MNKFKKLLLTLAPLSAVAIATPIILTSCSTNATNPNGSTDQKPGEGGDSGSGGGGDTGTNGNITPDSTNNSSFEPEKQGLYKSLEDTIKSGIVGQEDAKFEEAFSKYANPTEIDVKDAINIWSFNKWNEASQKENVKFNSQLLDVNATSKKDGDKNKWDISFKYKFQIITTIGDKTENILAEKTYTASNIELKATIPFTTQPSMLMVNGLSKLEEVKPKSFYAEEGTNNDSDAVKVVKDFLKLDGSNFDSKANFQAFVKSKNIVGEQVAPTPVWQESATDKMAVVSKDDPTIMTVTFTDQNPGWSGNIRKNAKLSEIRAQLKIKSTNDFVLTYIKDREGWNATFDEGTLDSSTKSAIFKITLKKENLSDVVLQLVFKEVTVA